MFRGAHDPFSILESQDGSLPTPVPRLGDEGLAAFGSGFFDEGGDVFFRSPGADAEDSGDFGIGFSGEEVREGFALAAGEGGVVEAWEGEGYAFLFRFCFLETVEGDGEVLAEEVDHQLGFLGKNTRGDETGHDGGVAIRCLEADVIHDLHVAVELRVDGGFPDLAHGGEVRHGDDFVLR